MSKKRPQKRTIKPKRGKRASRRKPGMPADFGPHLPRLPALRGGEPRVLGVSDAESNTDGRVDTLNVTVELPDFLVKAMQPPPRRAFRRYIDLFHRWTRALQQRPSSRTHKEPNT